MPDEFLHPVSELIRSETVDGEHRPIRCQLEIHGRGIVVQGPIPLFTGAKRRVGSLALSDIPHDGAVVFSTVVLQIIEGDFRVQDSTGLRPVFRFKRQ